MEGYSFITLTENGACNLLPRRDILSHKGSFGTLLIASGSENYIGAASLCTESALKSGAGIVCLASVRLAGSVCAARCPEATYLICDEKDGQISAEAADRILEKAKTTIEYKNLDCEFKLGIHQINNQINTFYFIENEFGEKTKIYNYPDLNGNLNLLKVKLKEYFDESLRNKLFLYELLK